MCTYTYVGYMYTSLTLTLTFTLTLTVTLTPTFTPSLTLTLTFISHFDSERVSYGHIRVRSRSLLTVPRAVCTELLPPHCSSSYGDAPQAGASAPISSGLIVSVSFHLSRTDPTLP